MRTVPLLATALVLSCGMPPATDPNGVWAGADAGLIMYDWHDGEYWAAKGLVLNHAALLLDEDCTWVSTINGRVIALDPSPDAGPPIGSVYNAAGTIRLRLAISDAEVDEGYRFTHRQSTSTLVGQVRMSFDAGLYIEGPDKATFRWQADYSDEVSHLQTEGGEIQLKRAATCQ